MPSFMDSAESPSWQCEADARVSVASFHGCAAGPLPTAGKAVSRSRAAPMGISVTVSTGSSERTGLGCNTATKPRASSVHWGIFRALAFSSRGTASGVKGCPGSVPARRTSAKELAGDCSSSTRP